MFGSLRSEVRGVDHAAHECYSVTLHICTAQCISTPGERSAPAYSDQLMHCFPPDSSSHPAGLAVQVEQAFKVSWCGGPVGTDGQCRPGGFITSYTVGPHAYQLTWRLSGPATGTNGTTALW